MATTTTRVKDISTTATSEAADDFYLMDGASNGTRKLAAANAAKGAITTHNGDATAHGFGVYTVAQLNAFTDSNRPIGCVYCTDCLTPEGVGSPVVWSGTQWVTTCSGIPATTDLLTYFRGVRAAGRTFYSAAGKLTRFAKNPAELSVNQFTNSGADSGVSIGFDGEGNSLSTGSTSTGMTRVSDYADAMIIGESSGGRSGKNMYVAATVWFSALSTSADEYHARIGISSANATTSLGTSEVCLVYDRANTLGLSGTPGCWLAVSRSLSVNTTTPLTNVPTTDIGVAQELEVLLTTTASHFYINGILVAEHTTNIPVGTPAKVLRPNLSISKIAGTASIGLRFQRFVDACRF